MYPWGHLAVAYLLYSLYARGRFRRPPKPAPVLAVLVGSQFADLLDKPLWFLGVFPTGRDLGHSLLFAGVLIVAVYAVALVFDRVETATAFVVAHLSHLLADLPPRFFLGYPFGTEFLLWPIVSHGTFGYSEQVFEPPELVALVVTPFTDPATFLALEFVLVGLALALWYVDGRPGLEYVRRGERGDCQGPRA
ncbi:metal-dependent hydrolase [Natronobacterium texcoconense]|uniref:LexA-binding, inner membrane-associated putative hydrolase n=1 Tax=Natronobacterium texcoconense TaxID=1095778 RepID=A0A1H0ZTW9_NATTX|nr:metal-dependent hydrolase [Natronobacterium texcoconense]SDQ30858.1 LexA-binding, inner membrane-associated putative hydrolase [Natronobacterium texcoconense]